MRDDCSSRPLVEGGVVPSLAHPVRGRRAPWLAPVPRSSGPLARLHVLAAADLVPAEELGRPRAHATPYDDVLDLGPAPDPLEVSARLDLPLGVARVLVADMADEGLVILHRPASPGDRPDLALLERVLYGLRTI